ncbi:MAG: hypothetical protein OXS28_02000 [Gammaproteobacteria bacterium]|nr:hypothetical protein [Gammaproteobacteria bacterium]
MHFLRTLVISVSILFSVASTAQQSSYAPQKMPDDAPAPAIVLDIESTDIQPERETARLRIQVPAANQEFREERRCMTFCSSWGEDCVMLNAGTDHVSKKCVRTCKSFAEECL